MTLLRYENAIFSISKCFRRQILDSRPKTVNRYLSEVYRRNTLANRLSFLAKHCFAENEALLCSGRTAFREIEK